MTFFTRGSCTWEVLRGAAIGTLFGGALWLASRGWGEVSFGLGPIRVGGEGWLTGWAVPWWALLLTGAGLGSVIGLIRFAHQRRRSAGMSDHARKLGLTYEETVLRSQLPGGSELFANWSSGQHGYHGEYRGTAIAVIDVIETFRGAGSDGADHKVRRTIALLPAEALPQFRLGPKTFSTRLAGALGVGGILFDDSHLGSTHAETVRQFERSWLLAPDEKPAGLSAEDAAAENERAVRRLFTPRLIQALCAFPRLNAQVRHGQLLVWRKKGLIAPQARASLLDDAIRLRETLLAGQERATMKPEAPLAIADPQIRAQRRIGMLVGAVAGFMLGFFAGFGVFATIFLSNSGPDDGIGLLFLLMPLLAFGGGAVMAVVGAFVGRRLSGLVQLPNTAGDGASTRRSAGFKQSAWRALGMFLGFAAGSVVGVGVFILMNQINWNDGGPPLWLLIPLFFSCPIAGVIGGLWASARIEARFERRKTAAPNRPTSSLQES